MPPKYGVPFTPEDWKGWSLRANHYPREGKLEGLIAETDAILVWSGGTSEMTLHERRASGETRVHRKTRQSGMIDFVPKGSVLEEVSWRGQESSCVSVSFDADRVQAMLGKPAAFERDGIRFGITDAHVVDLVRRLQGQAIGGQPWGSPYVEGLSMTLASYVYARYAHPDLTVAIKPSLAAVPAERLIAFVDENLGRNLRLTQLAALAGYSPDHFAKLFKHSFGLTPYQYILERRIERAKSLLRDRAHSINEVAMLCGFASQAHFQTTFKMRTGVTPHVYRKR